MDQEKVLHPQAKVRSNSCLGTLKYLRCLVIMQELFVTFSEDRNATKITSLWAEKNKYLGTK